MRAGVGEGRVQQLVNRFRRFAPEPRIESGPATQGAESFGQQRVRRGVVDAR